MKRKLLNHIRTQKGLALISVLALVTLATVIVMALFTVSDAEFKASKVYAGGNSAKQLADSAVNLVIGQIRSATYNEGNRNAARLWASQPGAIRVYSSTGTFEQGYKLYSDGQMVVTGTDANITGDVPEGGWDGMPDKYVDMNDPVVRAEGTAVKVFYPIVDPRAAAVMGTFQPVEGFSYSNKTPNGGASINGVVLAGTGDVNALRLPMPVEWVYVLKDGTMGSVGGDGRWAGGVAPSEDNPIVGRIAFWTDDDSSHININTASEPGYWAVPTFFHDRDKSWVDAPPTMHEYQRFPGHPATVALSTVLYPGTEGNPKFLDSYPYKRSGRSSSASDWQLKRQIYDLMPRIHYGGSEDGRRVFMFDEVDEVYDSGATPREKDADIVRIWNQDGARPGDSASLPPSKEHLFASLDELMFDDGMRGNKRTENNFKVTLENQGEVTLLDETTLERTRFFMTASSKAPEVNLFGRPRVAMWPVPDATLDGSVSGSSGQKFRTGYDTAIATASTLDDDFKNSRNTYYFSRYNADSAKADIGEDAGASQGLRRNGELMNYLDTLMSSSFPGGASFKGKYGDKDSRQILVEIFDYIRTTNMYDSFLAPKFIKDEGEKANTLNESASGGMDYFWRDDVGSWGFEDNKSGNTDPGKSDAFHKAEMKAIYRRYRPEVNDRPQSRDYYTYTEPRYKVTKFSWTGTPTNVNLENEIVPSGVFPGHGQVTPTIWKKDGIEYKGFGRFPTISEIGLQFICTADGLNDEGSYRIRVPSGDKYVIPSFESANSNGTVSGGRTAEMIENELQPGNSRKAETFNDPYTGQSERRYWYSNFPPFPTAKTWTTWGAVASTSRTDPKRVITHPGADPENWNATLDRDTPLKTDEKRIQLAVLLEFFIPSLGWTKYCPEFTVVMAGESLSGIQAKNSEGKWNSVFSTTEDQVLKSNLEFGGGITGMDPNHGIYPLGGHYSPRAITQGRRVKGTGNGMPTDPGYDDDASSSDESGLYNYPFVSSFFTVKRDEEIKYKVNNPMKFDLYSNHKWQNTQPVQSFEVQFPTGEQAAPPPELVRYSTQEKETSDENAGTRTRIEESNACRWWCFNFGGAMKRYKGAVRNNAGSPDFGAVRDTEGEGPTRGRFASWDSGRSSVNISKAEDPNGIGGNIMMNGLIYGYAPTNSTAGVKSRSEDLINRDLYQPSDKGAREMGSYGYFGSDTVRSMVPKYGDYRILAGRTKVAAGLWTKHALWDSDNFFAHNFSSFFSDVDVGFHRGGQTDQTVDNKYRLVKFSSTSRAGDGQYWEDYQYNVIPDLPMTRDASEASQRYGDFDNGPGDSKDGAYINKPDEGNASAIILYMNGKQRFMRNAYFRNQYMQIPVTEAYFTPNRMISSPGMFGSLSTGIWGGQSKLRDGTVHGEPWRTLLFRPNVGSTAANRHPGAPGSDGGADPADHYIMDLFWMPIVEPYAISDSYATAGKINMNFQIVPFTYITRATAMYAAMKGELITCVPRTDVKIRDVKQRTGGNQTKSYKQIKDESQWPPIFFNDDKNGGDRKYWQRYIDLKVTTALMKNKMDGEAGIFRTASQICEVHLVPQSIAEAPFNPVGMNEDTIPSVAKSNMAKFWSDHALTGDNSRERPYANLYQKLTTRSNTYRVYFRAQALKKARSLDPGQVSTVSVSGSSTDTVIAEYRGSALIERYLDLSSDLPNYAVDPFSKQPLDAFYRYRVLEAKQFAP